MREEAFYKLAGRIFVGFDLFLGDFLGVTTALGAEREPKSWKLETSPDLTGGWMLGHAVTGIRFHGCGTNAVDNAPTKFTRPSVDTLAKLAQRCCGVFDSKGVATQSQINPAAIGPLTSDIDKRSCGVLRNQRLARRKPEFCRSLQYWQRLRWQIFFAGWIC